MKKKNEGAFFYLVLLRNSFIFTTIMAAIVLPSCSSYTVEKKYSSPALSGLTYYDGILFLADEDIIWKIDSEGTAYDYIETPCRNITGLSAYKDGFWCIDKNVCDNGSIINTVYLLDFNGNPLTSFTLSYPCLPGDLTYDGKHLFVINRYNGSILQLNSDGDIVNVIWLDFEDPNAITAVGDYLWVSSNTGQWHLRTAITLYKLSKQGAVLNSCKIPADYAPGLAHDENSLYVVLSGGIGGGAKIYTIEIHDFN